MSRRQKSDKTIVESQIESAKESLLYESARLDTKLADILDTQLKQIPGSTVIDHSFPLIVAYEITKINAYANTLDPESQDAMALKSSVSRLTRTLKSAKYEIVDLLGQKYDDGLKVIVVDAVPDENLKAGEEVITKIIKPLVKYKGEQIQAAHVDISIGQ